MKLRVLSPATARSSITLANGAIVAQVPGTMLDIDAHLGEYLIANGWTRVGTVGPTASRPSSNPASGVGAYLAQANSLHIDSSLNALLIHNGSAWINPLTGAAV
jgi:hypothetical protein